MIESVLCLPLVSFLLWSVLAFWQKLEQKAQNNWNESASLIFIQQPIQSHEENKLPSLDTHKGPDLLTRHSDGSLAQSVEQ